LKVSARWFWGLIFEQGSCRVAAGTGSIRLRAVQALRLQRMFDNEIDWVNKLQG